MPRVGLAVSALLLASACGTTVPLAQVNSSGADGLSPVTAPTAGSTAGGALGGSTSLGGTSGGSSTTGGGSGTSSTGATTGVLPGPAGSNPTRTSGPVVRATGPVKVGLLYLDGVDQVASALGISGLSTGDAQAQAQAITNWVNAHGGLGGQRIDLKVAKIAASDANTESAWEAACTSLTEDQKVSWVISYLTLNETRVSCYQRHHVTIVDDQAALPDDLANKHAAAFAAPGDLLPGRAAAAEVDALIRTGWLTPKSVIGSLVYDTPAGIDIETRYLAPALARHGLKIAVAARAPLSADGANQSGTALKFRSSGVDRVIPLGASPLFLMNAAESQNYRPKYAMNSVFGPGALLESAAPPNQLKGAAGIGWSKYLDIGAGTKPGPVSANETLCLQIMKSSGQQANGTVPAFQTALCNVLFAMKAGADKHGLTGDLFSALRNEQFTYAPADAYAVRLAPTRTDGATAYRDLAFQDGCGCFQYTSGNRSVS